MNESCRTYNLVMSHIFMSHVAPTKQCVLSHICMSHVAHMDSLFLGGGKGTVAARGLESHDGGCSGVCVCVCVCVFACVSFSQTHSLYVCV